MDIKFVLSSIAILLTIVVFIPYIRTIGSGETKPHMFSWLIWGITTIIVFFAQLEAEGGVGAWSTGVAGVLTIYIAVVSVVKRADISITRLDWLFFIAALGSIPVWYLADDPLLAVILLTTVDILAFGPTMRKAYDFPYQENLMLYKLYIVRNIFAIVSLETYSVATMLFPVAVTIACIWLVVMVTYRRRMVPLP